MVEDVLAKTQLCFTREFFEIESAIDGGLLFCLAQIRVVLRLYLSIKRPCYGICVEVKFESKFGRV